MNIHLKPDTAQPLPPFLLNKSSADVSRQGPTSRALTIAASRNNTIFDEGSEARFYYEVISGAVRLCKYFPDGRRQIAAFFFSGDVFGIEGVSEYIFTAEAASDCILLKRDRNDLLNGSFPHDRDANLSALLYHRLSDTMLHLLMVGRQTVTERISSFLLLLADRSENYPEHGVVLQMCMSRQDIADYLALTIETVCRSLSKLKQAKIIDIPTAQQIVIRDMDRLRDLAAGEV